MSIHAPEVWDPWDPDWPARNRDFTAQATFSEQVDVGALTGLSLTGIAGTVKIMSGGVSEISVEAVRRVRSDSQSDADRSLPGLTVDVAPGDAMLYVATRQPPRTNGRAYEVDYRITVPDGFDLFVELVAGDIEASATLGDKGVFDFVNVAGSIELDIPVSTSAWLRADVVTGSIRLSNLALNDQDPKAGVVRGTLGSGDGSITLSTVAGDVTVRGR